MVQKSVSTLYQQGLNQHLQVFYNSNTNVTGIFSDVANFL